MPYAPHTGTELAQKCLQIYTALFYVQNNTLQKAFHLIYANSVFSY